MGSSLLFFLCTLQLGHTGVQMPVAGLKGRQIGLAHAKHELDDAFGQLQLSSGPPLAVRGLDGLLKGHWMQFGCSPYHPCKQQVLPLGQLKNCKLAWIRNRECIIVRPIPLLNVIVGICMVVLRYFLVKMTSVVSVGVKVNVMGLDKLIESSLFVVFVFNVNSRCSFGSPQNVQSRIFA